MRSLQTRASSVVSLIRAIRVIRGGIFQSGRPDSNRRRQRWERCTLPLSYARIFSNAVLILAVLLYLASAFSVGLYAIRGVRIGASADSFLDLGLASEICSAMIEVYWVFAKYSWP
jgi:hypothetical protein